MTSRYTTERTASTMITAHTLPAILIGGPPNAGKSVLTYNLTRELRRRDIPHYVFRANPDIEGDWFLQDDQDNVRQLTLSIQEYRHWTDAFRALVCHDLSSRRHLPLIVDLGGLPREEDHCIFRACTHAILLLKDNSEEEKAISQTWRNFIKKHSLPLLAEIHSQRDGESILTSQKPMIQGTLTQMQRGKPLRGLVFEALVDSLSDLLSPYTENELEKLHLGTAPIESVVHIGRYLQAIAPDTEEWTSDLLEPLLAKQSPQTAIAVYGRGPNWLYSALALHAGTQPFYQFDARLGWVCMPTLRIHTSGPFPQSPLCYIESYTDDDQYVLLLHPIHNYIDYTEVDQLAFPEPPPSHGVIISGKLPLWLFTALARFYAQWNVPWIALNDAHDNTAVVISSQMETYLIGDRFSMPI